MKIILPPRYILLALLFVALLLAGCGHRHGRVLEVAYVSAPQVFLRDHMAAVYNKTGIVKNGDRVEVLEKDRRFARVRTSAGEEGWLEQRYLVGQDVFDGFQKLATEAQTAPIEASATTRNDTNLHLTPGRDTEHLRQITEGTKVSMIERSTVEKTIAGMTKPAPSSTASVMPAAIPMEDWWLVRDAQGHAGWVLGRMLDVDVPLEIAQYAEGQRIVAVFVLNQVTDADKKVPQYLVAFSEPKDGMPFDFDQVRVFTWNIKRHRYETAYRERGLNGVLPISVTHESFDKEGDLPVFVVRVKDDGGNVSERKYKLNTPIVRRVLAPGEAKTTDHPAAKRPAGRGKRRK